MAFSPATPLTPVEVVPDNALRSLALEDPGRARGELCDEDVATLCMYLPDMCSELLARRAMDRAGIGPEPTAPGDMAQSDLEFFADQFATMTAQMAEISTALADMHALQLRLADIDKAKAEAA